jgi:hypothetical protein
LLELRYEVSNVFVGNRDIKMLDFARLHFKKREWRDQNQLVLGVLPFELAVFGALSIALRLKRFPYSVGWLVLNVNGIAVEAPV